ncbi:MAG: peptidase [Microcoleaceae cyanobacterium]
METGLNQFLDLVWGALTLNSDVFNWINSLPQGNQVALIIVLIAGLAQAVGQCVVLFLNRVQPKGFFISLGIASILFTFSYVFWAGSIGLVANFFFNYNLDYPTIFRTLGLSYAPLILGFLVALPYIGIPIYILLSLWALLAEITGLQVLTDLNAWGAFACAGLGWVVLQALQRTIGRPILVIGRWLKNLAAGKVLITDKQELENILMQGNLLTVNAVSNEIWIEAKTSKPQLHQSLSGVQFVALGLVTFILIIIFSIGQNGITVWYQALTQTLRLIIDLVGVSVIALFCSILLTPLEALTWWAGWYEPEPVKYKGTAVKPLPEQTAASRYVIYLDGINQGAFTYLPRVERLLNELAASTPDDILIVKGIMPYSINNRPLSADRHLAFVWKIIASLAQKNPSHPISLIINIRNIVAVAIAADPRYGPIQNQALAQVLLDSLVSFGYPIGSQIPVTLIGYSGGGQMSMGAVSYLKHALQAPIDVISLAGVMSGNTGTLQIERLYHLVGKKDLIERLGPVVFPGRWAMMVLSNWNRAKRRGKISFISLGPVGHNGETGLMGEEITLSDGRTPLQQTVDIITAILAKDWEITGLNPDDFRSISNYERYQAALFNQLNYYPINQSINLNYYQPVGTWMGRLILPQPEQRQQVRGVLFEIYHTDATNYHRIGQIVNLRWENKTEVKTYVELVTQTVKFNDQAHVSQQQGNIHPCRINNWLEVDPLESLAGAHPDDDVVVKLPEPLRIEDNGLDRPTVYIQREPIQIRGRFYALVKIIQFLGGDLFLVRHYHSPTQRFEGEKEIIYIPSVIANRNGVLPSYNPGIQSSPINESGWYIYGAKNMNDRFVVQAIAPYKQFLLHPDRVIYGEKATINYINYHYWDNVAKNQGKAYSVQLNPWKKEDKLALHNSQWKLGDRGLLLHLYGGMGGKKAEFSPLGIFFGHFAFGIAEVVQDALTQQLRFDIEYRQIYTHNPDGIIAGTLDWERYLGDRQWGWLGSRPTSDIIVKFSPLTEDYDFNGIHFSPLSYVIQELDVMAARYRIGDGNGTTFVSPINSCVQDSGQAVYTALRRMTAQFELNPLIVKWLREHPRHEQTQRFIQLGNLLGSLENYLTPMGKVRSDWRYNQPTLGGFPVETPGKTLWMILSSWRTLLPRWTNDQLAMIFLQLGASLWLLRTNQVGGHDPYIKPIAPTDFGFAVPKVQQTKVQ